MAGLKRVKGHFSDAYEWETDDSSAADLETAVERVGEKPGDASVDLRSIEDRLFPTTQRRFFEENLLGL